MILKHWGKKNKIQELVKFCDQIPISIQMCCASTVVISVTFWQQMRWKTSDRKIHIGLFLISMQNFHVILLKYVLANVASKRFSVVVILRWWLELYFTEMYRDVYWQESGNTLYTCVYILQYYPQNYIYPDFSKLSQHSKH